MRLIDADKLIANHTERISYKNSWHETEEDEFVAVKNIQDAPTVEAVPVIRCKDCKHSLQNQFTGDWFCWLYNIAREVESDGFCYKAERINSGQRYATDLVRCKDCMFRDPADKRCGCGHDIIWQLPRGDEWYCADAKRKQ